MLLNRMLISLVPVDVAQYGSKHSSTGTVLF